MHAVILSAIVLAEFLTLLWPIDVDAVRDEAVVVDYAFEDVAFQIMVLMRTQDRSLERDYYICHGVIGLLMLK